MPPPLTRWGHLLFRYHPRRRAFLQTARTVSAPLTWIVRIGYGRPSTPMTKHTSPSAPAPLEQALRQLADEARVLVRTCTGAALSVVTGGDVQIVGTSLLATQLDQAQWTSGQGPGLDAIHQLQVFNVGDLRSVRSWPEFTRLALARGVAGCLAVPITWRGRALGTLNLYSATPDGFAGREQLGLRLAADAAVALAATGGEPGTEPVPVAGPRAEPAVS